jgi:hypothetical protein
MTQLQHETFPVRMNVTSFYPHKINCTKELFTPPYDHCDCYAKGIPDDVQENYRAFAMSRTAQYSDIVWMIEDGRRVGRYVRGGKRHKRAHGNVGKGFLEAITGGARWKALEFDALASR